MPAQGALYSVNVTKSDKLPKPTGYRLLVAIPKVEEKTKGGIIRPDEYRDREEHASVVAYVLSIGPDAYADKSRFPSGAYCKVGDFVVINSYAGVRISVDGQEYRLINDDSVSAVVDEPTEIVRK